MSPDDLNLQIFDFGMFRYLIFCFEQQTFREQELSTIGYGPDDFRFSNLILAVANLAFDFGNIAEFFDFRFSIFEFGI